jgi:NDP-sugar pyrophosphorylase family protein
VSLLPVCILAGGIGSRLGDAVRETPKPLLPVAGRPFLRWQLDVLRTHGAQRVVLCVGYLGELIEAEIGDGSEHGLDVRYAYDPPRLAGTAGAVRGALPLLGDAFLVLYGDTYLRVDYADVQRAFEASGCPALMCVLRNEGRWDTSNAIYDGERVTYDKRHPPAGADWIDYGLGALRAEALEASGDPDLAGVYEELSRRGQLAGYVATERFYEIGTPAALAETEGFLTATARASGS